MTQPQDPQAIVAAPKVSVPYIANRMLDSVAWVSDPSLSRENIEAMARAAIRALADLAGDEIAKLVDELYWLGRAEVAVSPRAEAVLQQLKAAIASIQARVPVVTDVDLNGAPVTFPCECSANCGGFLSIDPTFDGDLVRIQIVNSPPSTPTVWLSRAEFAALTIPKEVADHGNG